MIFHITNQTISNAVMILGCRSLNNQIFCTWKGIELMQKIVLSYFIIIIVLIITGCTSSSGNRGNVGHFGSWAKNSTAFNFVRNVSITHFLESSELVLYRKIDPRSIRPREPMFEFVRRCIIEVKITISNYLLKDSLIHELLKGAFAEHANENTAFHACRVGDEVNGHPGTRIMPPQTFGWFQSVGTLYLTRKQAKFRGV